MPLIDSKWPVNTVTVTAGGTISDETGIATISATQVWTRVRFEDLTAAQKKLVVCDRAPLSDSSSEHCLAAFTFLLLYADDDACCCSCRPVLILGPGDYPPLEADPSQTSKHAGTFAPAGGGSPVDLYAFSCTFGFVPIACLGSYRSTVESTDPADAYDITADAALDVAGDATHDQTVLVTFAGAPAGSRRHPASADFDWTGPEISGEEDTRTWRFRFFGNDGLAGQPPQILSAKLPDGTTDSIALADAGRRFLLAATPTGGWIGFIGPYGLQALDNLEPVTAGVLASAQRRVPTLQVLDPVTDDTTIKAIGTAGFAIGGILSNSGAGEVENICPTDYSFSATLTSGFTIAAAWS